MKGILKGLRNISQMFEPNYKEPEMQIGYPTDVKHVAHIGWDGPSVTAPSWMNDFKSAPDFSTAPYNMERSPTKPSSSRGGLQEVKSRDTPELPKPSRRNKEESASSSSTTSTSKPRRHKKSSSGVESPPKDPEVPKESRRRKTRDSSNGGSTRSSSRSKVLDPDHQRKSNEQVPWT